MTLLRRMGRAVRELLREIAERAEHEKFRRGHR
jgi:hypothetical protein